MSEPIMLNNVRVSFPHLFTKPTINGEEGKCGATLMLDPEKNKSGLKKINTAIQELTEVKLKGRKLPSDKMCLRNGDDTGRPEYEGYWTLSANSMSRPLVISTNGRDVIQDEDESKIYAGCYVNAKIRLWFQDNRYGKRINAELVAIQFASDGEPLDGRHVSVEEATKGFDPVYEDEEDDDFLT